jgi:cobalt-zinc-cadmium efflux system membrane fusion protein
MKIMRNIKTFLVFCLVLSFSCCGRNEKVKKAKGDWCAEHNLPESQCTICNPSLKKGLKQKGHLEEDKEEQTVKISEESKQTIGLKVTETKYRTIEEILTVPGKIAPDTEKIYHVYPKVSGEVLMVRIKVGDIVKQGDILATIRSEKTKSDEEIISQYSGMVIAENISIGNRVDELTSIFTIADLGNIYANFDVYEKDIGKIKIGQKIKVKSTAYPDKIFAGRIIFISPTVDDRTKTIKIRAEIDNNEYLLRFNMFVTGDIVIRNPGKYLSIPTKAIQTFGEKEIVFVQTSDNEFMAREVEIGFSSGELSQVVNGLKEGEKVVTEGSFLLKSELLKSKLGAGCAE